MPRSQIAIYSQMTPGLNGESIVVLDIDTGSILCTFKSAEGLRIGRHSIGRIGYQYICNIYQGSPIFTIWSLDRKDRLHKKIILPKHPQALTITQDGYYCLVAIETKVYIWQISSGYLVAVVDGHYQNISTIHITGDMSYFITGGQDGLVMIWKFIKIIQPPTNSFIVQSGQLNHSAPEKIINYSSMAVADLYLNGSNSDQHSRFVVCWQQSKIVRIYQLPDGNCLASIDFPDFITSVTMDRIERFLFCGSAKGPIYQISLSSSIGSTMAMKSGAQSEHYDLTENQEERNKSSKMQIFDGHSEAITCLGITIDGQGLLSGSQDKTIRLWHIDSNQGMRTIAGTGPISNLLVYPSMAGLFLMDSLESSNYLLNQQAGPSTTKLPNTSRPQMIEQALKSLPNPPKPIADKFNWDLYQPKFNPFNLIKTISHIDRANVANTVIESSTSSGKLNPFQNGCLWIRNSKPSTNIASFDKENMWLIDYENNLNDTLTYTDTWQPDLEFQQEFVNRLNAGAQKNQASNKSNNTQDINNINGDRMITIFSAIDDEPDENNERRKLLENINYNLYNFAMKEIFSSTMFDKVINDGNRN